MMRVATSECRKNSSYIYIEKTSSVQRTRIEETVKKSKSKKSRQRYFSSTGRTDAIGIGASDGCRMIRRPGNWHKSVRL